jgi:hypothetical protein
MNIGGLRPFPFPYKAMMTICSDLDETPDSSLYFETARFLNTTQGTSAGTGLGLEIGNTIYFDMPDEQFAYWNTDDHGRKQIRSLIQSGHIDCFHSFGDLATHRDDARRALDELADHDCLIECWVDHAAAKTNFGEDIMRGEGDLRTSDAYHADLTYDYGVRFVWRGRVTSVIGQNRPRSLRGLFSINNPVQSARTIGTEWAKGFLAKAGNRKYSMHAGNDTIVPSRLRDGRRVYEFMRCNPFRGGVSGAATADGLGEVLTLDFLNRLVERQGVCVLYTHLGKTSQPDSVFPPRTIEALRRLSAFSERRDLLVTTTRRLLRYCLATRLVDIRLVHDDQGEVVYLDTSGIHGQGMPADVSGITIYVTDSDSARVVVDSVEVTDLRRNPADESGLQSVSLPWQPLCFPDI